MAYQLPVIPFLRLRFILTAVQETFLPSNKGSLLRGAFGHALRRTVCVMGPQQPCPTCMLRQQCSYPRIFETLIEPDVTVPRFLRGLPTAPRPYIFDCTDERNHLDAGASLQFDLILLGQACELHAFAIFAVSQMAAHGLGFKRLPFRLESCKWQVVSGEGQEANGQRQKAMEQLQTTSMPAAPDGWRLLYDGATKRLLENPIPQRPPHSQIPTSQLPPVTFDLRFLTPTRLKFDNNLTIDFTFRMLVFKMLRRVLELAHFHMPGAAVNWEFHDLLVAADAVQIVQRDLRWIDWERRSNRQKAEMLMGGFIGKITLKGELSPFQDLLRSCEVVHVGKGCVFGNGKISCSATTPD